MLDAHSEPRAMAASDTPRPLGGLVTGGAGDIGAAIADALARMGVAVTLFDSKTEVAAEPWLAGFTEVATPRYVTGDVRDPAAVRAVIDSQEALDIVVCNAGIVHASPVLETTLEKWEEQISVNLTGTFVVAQAAARRMVEVGKGGTIVFVGSWVGSVPWPEIAPYSASKAGVAMLARSMALELAPHHIRVNVVAPGIVNAGMAGRMAREDPAYARKAGAVIPLRSLQTPEEVADAVCFLASPRSSSITGTTILVDGGASLFNFPDPGRTER